MALDELLWDSDCGGYSNHDHVEVDPPSTIDGQCCYAYTLIASNCPTSG